MKKYSVRRITQASLSIDTISQKKKQKTHRFDKRENIGTFTSNLATRLDTDSGGTEKYN